MNRLSAEELQTLLQHGRYSIEGLDTLKGVLADAFALYDIGAGKGRLSKLLTVIEKPADPEVFSLIIFDLARFLRRACRRRSRRSSSCSRTTPPLSQILSPRCWSAGSQRCKRLSPGLNLMFLPIRNCATPSLKIKYQFGGQSE